MTKEVKKISYSFIKNVLGTVFNIYYRPKYFNKDLIPTEGPIIVCCNHMHLFDQNMACNSTKRMLHYMAKIEYLQGKFAWFFKAAGCIFVDREAHDGVAKNLAMDELSNGHAVGIFPEGTRNQLSCRTERLKELYPLYENDMDYETFYKIVKKNAVKTSQIDKLIELKNEGKINDNNFKGYLLNADKYLNELVNQNIITYEEYINSLLLPFKFGAVSMAQKTGAYIVPCAITGKYRFRNNHLNIRFGTPFKVPEDMDLKEANDKLFNSISNLKKEGIEYIRNKIN